MQVDTSRIVRGNYMIYKFTNQIFKVVKFKCTEIPLKLHDDTDSQKHYSEKLDNSVSRTRRLILEKALCNPWEWFCTLTLDKAKYDRFNLPAYYKDLSQWLRDQRKKGFSFSVSDLWVLATQNNKLNGVLDEVKTELKEQGTTLNQVLKEQGITNDKLDDVLGEQEETNDKLDNIINGTVDSTLPPDSGTVDEFHKQEEEIMGSVNEGFDTALGVLEDTLISIMEMLAGFHAIAYIFNLFYSLPLIQLA